MVRATGTYTLKTWKLDDLKRSELNARLDIENDPDTKALAASIKVNGIMQEPAVRDDGTIIYGTRRVIAAGLAGLKEVVCRTYPKGMTVQQEHTLRIIENLERKDLNPIEKATELRALVDMQTGKGKQKAAAAALGYAEAALSRSLALLELPEEWQLLLRKGLADPTHARIIPALSQVHEKLPKELAQLYNCLTTSKSITVKDWEEEAARYVNDISRPCHAPEGTKPLPLYEAHRTELDIRNLNGKPVAFNVAAWKKITDDAQAQAEKEAAEEEPKTKTPDILVRQRIVLAWINRRFQAYCVKHPAAAVKWLPLLELSFPVRSNSIHWAAGGGRGGPDALNPLSHIWQTGKIKASGVMTYLAEYLKEAAMLASRDRLWFIKDFAQGRAILKAIGITYAEEFLASLTPAELAELQDAYGSEIEAKVKKGVFPTGMRPADLSIT